LPIYLNEYEIVLTKIKIKATEFMGQKTQGDAEEKMNILTRVFIPIKLGETYTKRKLTP
jgi:hypothetical protein